MPRYYDGYPGMAWPAEPLVAGSEMSTSPDQFMHSLCVMGGGGE